jgi:hypothetical protein
MDIVRIDGSCKLTIRKLVSARHTNCGSGVVDPLKDVGREEKAQAFKRNNGSELSEKQPTGFGQDREIKF